MECGKAFKCMLDSAKYFAQVKELPQYLEIRMVFTVNRITIFAH